jgi:hypothetical protein
MYENNIKEIALNSFEEFEKIANNMLLNKQNSSSNILFRGQANDKWLLQSTLERYDNKISVDEYCTILQKIKPKFEEATSKTWEFDCSSYNGTFIPPIGYEFMSYIRHLGFPTPILDWSRDYNIASFFAFKDKTDSKFVSIYIYQEYKNNLNLKGGIDSLPFLSNLTKDINTHERHDLQKAEYTICRRTINKQQYYISHELGFRKNLQGYDECIKYIIPRNEQVKVLKKLDKVNINKFRLFNDANSLAKKLCVDKLF